MIRKAPSFAEAPTFPCAIASGLPVRDVFALVAMHAMVSNPDNAGDVRFFSATSYALADAMLKARSTKEEK